MEDDVCVVDKLEAVNMQTLFDFHTQFVVVYGHRDVAQLLQLLLREDRRD